GLTLLYADATNNTISGCWFGVDSTGTNAAPNANQGILIAAGASRNIIGPGNVLSGNSQYGVFITDSNTTGNVVLGNYIGTDASGTNALANGKSGVFIGNGASSNIIGSMIATGRNILSGNNEYGVIMASNTTANVVLGNYIGTDANGRIMLSNVLGGVFLADGATNNLIGGTNAGARNIISGNGLPYVYGVLIAGPGASGNVVEGNYIGVGADGTTPVPNYWGIVCSSGAVNNTFGGTVAGARNVISGNLSEGLRLTDPGTAFNVVQGNYFGTDVGGSLAIPNNYANVNIQNGANSNLVGGVTVAARNLITANYYNVVIDGGGGYGTSGNLVQGNYIGTDITGTNGLGFS
ncbi:MAG: hypothetical protein ACRED1_00200, partial [Limisphaerales bacterium]